MLQSIQENGIFYVTSVSTTIHYVKIDISYSIRSERGHESTTADQLCIDHAT